MKQYQPHASSVSGIAANLLACGVYILLAVFGGFWSILIAVVLLLVEKYSGLVRFSVMQGFLLLLVYNVLRGVIDVIRGVSAFSFFGFNWVRTVVLFGADLIWGLASVAVILLYIVCFLYCAIKAYRWQQVEFPLLGKITYRILEHFGTVAYTGDGPVPPQAELIGKQDRHR